MKSVFILFATMFMWSADGMVAAAQEKTTTQSRQRQTKLGARVAISVQDLGVLAPGAVVPVSLKILSRQNARSLKIRFQAQDGLTLLEGAQFVHFDAVQAGETFVHTVKLSATQAGHYRLTAVIQLDSINRTLAKVVSVPVTVGQPAPRAKVLEQTVQSAGGVKVLPAELRNR
jgi:hypothetical protein